MQHILEIQNIVANAIVFIIGIMKVIVVNVIVFIIKIGRGEEERIIVANANWFIKEIIVVNAKWFSKIPPVHPL